MPAQGKCKVLSSGWAVFYFQGFVQGWGRRCQSRWPPKIPSSVKTAKWRWAHHACRDGESVSLTGDLWWQWLTVWTDRLLACLPLVPAECFRHVENCNIAVFLDNAINELYIWVLCQNLHYGTLAANELLINLYLFIHTTFIFSHLDVNSKSQQCQTVLTGHLLLFFDQVETWHIF